mmetsp:Transcript_597/g.1084  ORF Transcript_597/g.1084 Transcript_597/m.1084 type:complete len:235 (+) Transcript_597:1285-1989(+)
MAADRMLVLVLREIRGGRHEAAAGTLEGPERLGRELKVVADKVGRISLTRHRGRVFEGQLALQLVLLHGGLVSARVHLRVGGEHMGRQGRVLLLHELLLLLLLVVRLLLVVLLHLPLPLLLLEVVLLLLEVLCLSALQGLHLGRNLGRDLVDVVLPWPAPLAFGRVRVPRRLPLLSRGGEVLRGNLGLLRARCRSSCSFGGNPLGGSSSDSLFSHFIILLALVARKLLEHGSIE